MKELIKKYEKEFQIKKFLTFIESRLEVLGVQLVYSALLLYNALIWGQAPTWAKTIILGTLGYLLSPLDTIPDLTPFIGFTDDIGILAMGLVLLAAYIDDDIKAKARKKVYDWFDDVKESDLDKIDQRF